VQKGFSSNTLVQYSLIQVDQRMFKCVTIVL